MKFCHLCLIAIACLFAFSCEKVSIDSDTYTKYFDLVSDDVPGSYVDVVPTELLSKQYVEKHIVGYGWESVAIYRSIGTKMSLLSMKLSRMAHCRRLIIWNMLTCLKSGDSV